MGREGQEPAPAWAPPAAPLEPTALSWAVASGEVVLSDIPHRGGRTAVCVYMYVYVLAVCVHVYTVTHL